MASREFLKILSSARLGDVSAQQNLAQAYLTGAFKTPIQPANALIWLEKSYFSITNQTLEDQISSNAEIFKVLTQVASIPLVGLLASPIIGLLQQTPFLGDLLAPIIGGLGTVFGPVIGALGLHFVSEMTRHVTGRIPGIDLVLYGALLVVMVAFARDGIIGLLMKLRSRLGWAR